MEDLPGEHGVTCQAAEPVLAQKPEGSIANHSTWTTHKAETPLDHQPQRPATAVVKKAIVHRNVQEGERFARPFPHLHSSATMVTNRKFGSKNTN